MIKKMILAMVFLLMAASVVASEKINLMRTGFEEVTEPGDEVPFFISIANVHDRGLDNIRVRIDSPEIELLGYSKPVDISSGDTASFSVPVDIPVYAEPGDYYIRITITDNEEIHRDYYRILTVR